MQQRVKDFIRSWKKKLMPKYNTCSQKPQTLSRTKASKTGTREITSSHSQMANLFCPKTNFQCPKDNKTFAFFKIVLENLSQDVKVGEKLISRSFNSPISNFISWNDWKNILYPVKLIQKTFSLFVSWEKTAQVFLFIELLNVKLHHSSWMSESTKQLYLAVSLDWFYWLTDSQLVAGPGSSP